MKLKKNTAWVLSAVLAFAGFFHGSMSPVKAGASPTLEVQFESTYSSETGTVSYKATSESDWIEVPAEGLTATAAYAVKYEPAEGYALASYSALRVDGSNVIADGDGTNTADNVANSLKNASTGYVLLGTGAYLFEHVEFVTDSSGGGGGGDGFGGTAYFVWKGTSGNICFHQFTGLVGTIEDASGGATCPLNYLPQSSVTDDVTSEQYSVSNKDFYWVLPDAFSSVVSTKTSFSELEALDARDFALDPAGPVDGASTSCSNGDRQFRTAIYDEGSFEGLAFHDKESDYTYFPSFWDPVFFSSMLDISGTSASAPAVYETFMLEPNVYFSQAPNSKDAITGVTALDVPSGAVSISESGGMYALHFNSNFFDSVVFEIATTGGNYYVKIVRITVKMMDNRAPGLADADAVVNTTLMYDENDSYSNYEVYATITYSDGTTKFQTLNPTGTEAEGGKKIKQMVYPCSISGVSSVSINVVKAGSVSSSSFTGAYCGSGNGVTFDTSLRRVVY